ncbi:MAG TPA: hypothetical protein VFG46_30820 [Chryseolinea sp.]|nr:hypothetical protein [Chryseolinea sp.]
MSVKWDDVRLTDDVEQRVILQKAWVNLALGDVSSPGTCNFMVFAYQAIVKK